jgi:hypothetical protein
MHVDWQSCETRIVSEGKKSAKFGVSSGGAKGKTPVAMTVWTRAICIIRESKQWRFFTHSKGASGRINS